MATVYATVFCRPISLIADRSPFHILPLWDLLFYTTTLGRRSALPLPEKALLLLLKWEEALLCLYHYFEKKLCFYASTAMGKSYASLLLLLSKEALLCVSTTPTASATILGSWRRAGDPTWVL